MATKTDGAVPIEQGGTGATTAEAAREKLELGDVLTESNSPFKKVGVISKSDDSGARGWELFYDGDGIRQIGVMPYSNSAIQVNPAGGLFADWQPRGTGLLITCPTQLAHSVWKAVRWGETWIAGVDVIKQTGAIAQVLLHVDGAQFFWNGDGSAYVPGALTCANVVQTSDRNKKSDIEPITDADDIIMSWTGCTFTLKTTGKASAGIIAQDVQEKFPVAVSTLHDESLGVDYSALHGPVIEALKNRITAEKEILARLDAIEKALGISRQK